MTDDISRPLHISPFEAIRKETEAGDEYWSARDLARILGYGTWDKFKSAIQRAEEACQNSSQVVTDHFSHVGKLIQAGKGAKRTVEDVHLSRFGSYLLIQNADPTKPNVALGQKYFAIQTRRQELADENADLPEDRLRLLRRSQMTIYNNQLAEAAQDAGVIDPFDFAIFQDHGYKGLYSLSASQIHTRKNLKKSQHILDHMGSDELAANIFRASQTKQKLERDQVQGKDEANRTHYDMGRKVRKFIKGVGGTLPEDLPTPSESIQQLQRKEQKRLKTGEPSTEEE